MVRIFFLHPDMGIGGAERLIADMALALKQREHDVTIYTTHHDTNHCFSETNDGTLLVAAKFDWLPRSVFGRCFALCAAVRMILLALYVRLFVCADIYIVDQVSICIPVLQLLSSKKVLFYCHYPDLLLTDRGSFLKSLYRAPLDYLEGWTTAQAHTILVNSLFTKGVVEDTFSRVRDCAVLYPSLNTAKFDNGFEIVMHDVIPAGTEWTFLSLNRYERKKNINLALEAFAFLKNKCNNFEKCHLIIAGGYDERVSENVEHHLELEKASQDLNIHSQVTFLRSVPDATKLYLLRNSTVLLYTPSREHFGIVPIESMYCQTPVIAVNSGGPLETIDHDVTGFLCEAQAGCFGEAMLRFVEDRELGEKMGKAGKERVERLFSFEAFTEQLDSAVLKLCDK